MSLRINQNVLSVNTYGTVAKTSSRLEKSIAKLSSGMRINSAADDAAGLAISEKMRRQIRGLSRATLNAQDGISMIQTAEGALNETHSILQRMRELATQSANDTLTSNDRLEIQKEVNQLRDEINRISTSTEFNTKRLLDGSQTALVSASSDSVKGVVAGAISGSASDYDVSLALLAGGASQMQRTQIFTLNDGAGTLADGGTQLQSIAQFYDANGVFVLDTPQSLNIHGNGKDTSVILDGQMTLDNLAADLQNALVSESGLSIDSSRTGVVNTVQSKIAGVGGYIEIVSGFVGNQGDFSIASDQRVVDALGFSVAREAVNSQIEVTAKDGFGNTRTVRTQEPTATGLLNGIDVHFSSQSAQIAGTKGLEEGLKFTSDISFNISAGGATFTASISGGGNHGWTMEGLARALNAQIEAEIGAGANGLTGLEAHVVDGEIRMAYEKPLSAAASIGNTITIVSATSNAHPIGLIDGSYSGFVDGQKDQDMAVWGFSRYINTASYGVGAGAVVMSVSDGIGGETITVFSTIGTAQVASAADMVQFINFQAEVNRLLDAATVAVRVDQIGGAMAFTSLRVGTENMDNASNITSMVTISNFSAGTDSLFSDKFGLSAGTSKGSGDTNFKMHVVDRQAQFQIGADQGQTMKVNIANMGSEALGIDNLDLTNIDGANKAMGKLNKAIDMVSSERSKLGAYQNRLEYTINNLRNTHSNLTASESRIRDADIAMEMIEFTRNQIVQQSGTAMLAQANMVPQGVLQLLG